MKLAKGKRETFLQKPDEFQYILCFMGMAYHVVIPLVQQCHTSIKIFHIGRTICH